MGAYCHYCCCARLCWWFFAARKYMEDYLKKNPPINEQMMRTMMIQMGQKPSEKKLHQMMNAMKNNYGKK